MHINNKNKTISIIDYGLGNIGSIYNMLIKVGAKPHVVRDPNLLINSNGFILPGVGSFDRGIINIKEKGFNEVLHNKVIYEKIPILGICLGMQLMLDGSDEGIEHGLKWIKGHCTKFSTDILSNWKVPHMGWNKVYSNNSKLLNNNQHNEDKFYFVHSYYLKFDKSYSTMLTNYNDFKFTSGYELDNIVGVQFHPEKSHRYGINLFNKFIKEYC